MRLNVTVFAVTAALLGIAINGCKVTTTTITPIPDPDKSDGGASSSDNGGDGAAPADSDDPANQPPHALGTVLLGEAHSAGGMSAPIVSVSFTPDARLGKRCTAQVAGCEVTQTPKCATACASGEACSFNDTCGSACVKVCTKSCASTEECYFASPDMPACRTRETFDAGAVAFSGTTTPLTLFPPYTFESKDANGAPFLAGASLEVQASGASSVGFEAFDEKFTATQFLQTVPSLDKIPRSTVFGSGTIPVAWTAGTDKIAVTVSGAGGSATCKADDTSGKFEIPRAVVQAVQGDAATSSTPYVSISVARSKTDVKKDKHTKGQLASVMVQPDAWVDLVTSSAETASFQGCASGTPDACTVDGMDTCVDLQSDTANCGKCGNACGSDQSCNAGSCSGGSTGQTCQTCAQGAATGACKSVNDACNADADCTAFNTCIQACASGDTTCDNSCVSAHSKGSSEYNDFVNCICTTACSSECTAECQ